MNTVALKELAEQAAVFAKAYVAVKEALMREGVVSDEAEKEARYAAMMAAAAPEEEEEWP